MVVRKHLKDFGVFLIYEKFPGKLPDRVNKFRQHLCFSSERKFTGQETSLVNCPRFADKDLKEEDVY